MTHKKYSEENILVSITGKSDEDWKSKLEEINSLEIPEVAVFLSQFTPCQREEIKKALLASCVKSIPLVHARDDFEKSDFDFFIKNFNTKCFTIHVDHLNHLDSWKGIHDKLFLELHFVGSLPEKSSLNGLGGFCIDLSHFKAAEDRKAPQYDFTASFKDKKELFKFNHLNGYDEAKKEDIHIPTETSQFNYLKNLQAFVIGDCIALEMEVPIKNQIEFRGYILKILNQRTN